MPLNANIIVGVTGDYTAASGLSTPTDSLALRYVTALTDGTGPNQANRRWVSQRTLAASASESIDLSGVLVDAFGAVLAFTAIKAILVVAAAGNTNDVIVGNAASNQFIGPFGAAVHTAAVRPGGELLFVAPATGWPVVAGTGDLLRILNGGAGTPVTYDITLIGIG